MFQVLGGSLGNDFLLSIIRDERTFNGYQLRVRIFGLRHSDVNLEIISEFRDDSSLFPDNLRMVLRWNFHLETKVKKDG